MGAQRKSERNLNAVEGKAFLNWSVLIRICNELGKNVVARRTHVNPLASDVGNLV